MRRIPIDAFPNSEPRRTLSYMLGSDFKPVVDLDEISFGTYSSRIARAMLKMTQDLDIIQRMKLSSNLSILEFGSLPNVSRVSPINFHLSPEEKFGMFTTGYIETAKSLRARGLVCDNDNAPFSTCASPSCFLTVSSGGRNLSSCAWIAQEWDRVAAASAVRESGEEGVSLGLWVLLFAAFVMIGSWALNKCRNRLHLFLLRKFSGIRTEKCAHCQRRWVPSELARHEVSRLTPKERAAALEARGLTSTDHRSKRSPRPLCGPGDPLHRALYIENISFRRPFSLVAACGSVSSRYCRNFPFEWSALLAVALAYGAWQYVSISIHSSVS